jgi:antitoxin VapB
VGSLLGGLHQANNRVATPIDGSIHTEKFCRGAKMPLNIKDPAAEKLVRELAAVTGETVTAAVRRAAEERPQRVRRERGGRDLAAEILEIGRRCTSLPDLDTRSADEILGYDEHGLPD